MQYPAHFIDDMKYLAQWYGWTEEEKKEVKKNMLGCEVTVRFFMVLAAAHRAGYNDPAGRCYMTLQQWCHEKGFPNPFEEKNIAYIEKINKLAKENNSGKNM